MIKKILIIIIVLIVVGFAAVVILTMSGVCPKYINLMPKIVKPGFSENEGTPAWYMFCPLSKKVY